ncbi:hypothetical protein RIF29_18265 [Crotalaria pallida]|uniref:Uncharacterized protein n=1 Tax=Crotalaria pallida TaxID=3830 RepID=A0AAN9FJL3_CROPI
MKHEKRIVTIILKALCNENKKIEHTEPKKEDFHKRALSKCVYRTTFTRSQRSKYVSSSSVPFGQLSQIYNHGGVYSEDYNIANTPAPPEVPASTPALVSQNEVEDDDDDEPPLNENDDDDDLDDLDQGDDQNTHHLVLAQFDKVARTKSRWKCTLKDGIMHINKTSQRHTVVTLRQGQTIACYQHALQTRPNYGMAYEKITRLEEELGEKNKEIGDIRDELGEKNKEIGAIRATLQAVLDHLGITMPEAHSMRTESSVHLADDHVDDFVDGDGDGGVVGVADDGDDHVPPTL